MLLSHLLHLQQQPGSNELWTNGERLIGGDQKLSTSIVIQHLKFKTVTWCIILSFVPYFLKIKRNIEYYF